MVNGPDLRKSAQLYQKNRLVQREKTKRRSRPFNLHRLRLDPIDGNRPARSTIRNQLVDYTPDLPEELSNDLMQEYVEDYWNDREQDEFMRSQWKEIEETIDNNNVDLLDSLIPPINVVDGTRNYWTSKSYEWSHLRDAQFLARAITAGHNDCVRLLLDKFYSGHLDPTAINYFPHDRKSPLVCAIKKRNFDLVRELVEEAHADIDQRGILLVAVESNDPIIVEYLLSQGTNPTFSSNKIALHDACRVGNSKIVEILLAYGANPNQRDYDDRTAFDYAIEGQHIEIVEILLLHTCGHIAPTQRCITPMMQAAHLNVKPIVDLLSRLLMSDRVANDFLRLACQYTILPSMRNREKALHFFVEGFTRKQTWDNSSLNELYDLRHECRTSDQLEVIRDNDVALRMNALIVNERIFLQTGDSDFYLDLIQEQRNHYRDHQLFNHSLQLGIHVYRSTLPTGFVSENWSISDRPMKDSLIDDLTNILVQADTVPISSLVTITNWILDDTMQLSVYRRFTLLKVIFCLIESQKMQPKEKHALYDLIRRLIRQQSEEKTYLYLLIHDIIEGTSTYQFGPHSLSILAMVRLLIQCGADVNKILDHQRNRPLHLIAQCSDINMAKPIIELLYQAGAHPDTIDHKGRIPKDTARTRDVRRLLIKHGQFSLKCCCARLIVSKNIDYPKYLTSNLVAFVRLHTNSEPNRLSRFYALDYDAW